jgi:hypothetical protein
LVAKTIMAKSPSPCFCGNHEFDGCPLMYVIRFSFFPCAFYHRFGA